ncbi:hypothetical protein EW146_g2125 [Bondarzewia mesenterica]|uniref:Uncharacterized protein n=1 Tax=Bondarzewia mesenterica TaxID=1095465 RepID=A0A4S4M3I1_9AGAM|nr:hypothetical protein EW146_g2125 [Bondarzewia mesenterica]
MDSPSQTQEQEIIDTLRTTLAPEIETLRPTQNPNKIQARKRIAKDLMAMVKKVRASARDSSVSARSRSSHARREDTEDTEERDEETEEVDELLDDDDDGNLQRRSPEEDEQHDPNHVNLAELDGAERRQFVLTKRAQLALSHFGKPPLTLEDVPGIVRWMHDNANVARVSREDLGFERLIRGYSSHTQPEWIHLFAGWGDKPLSWRNICRQSEDLDGKDDRTRIYHRQELLIREDQRRTERSFVDSVLNQIEVIKFAADWNSKGSGRGGRTWKKAYYEWAFAKRNPAGFQGLNNRERQAKLETVAFRGHFMSFKRGYERPVTARNNLLAHYRLFGSSVLMDPIWDVSVPRTPNFTDLLARISGIPPSNDEDDTPTRLDALRAQNDSVLLGIVYKLGGDVVHDYVRDFLANNY